MITKQEIQPVITKKVVITDSLFASYVNAIAEHLLPYQWKVLNDQIPGAEKSHCIDNFRIAAGEMEGTHQGAVFQDTDLYKWLETVAFCIANGTGREYIEIADEAIALIGRAQESDGYINTYFTISCPDKKWTNLVEGHELYSGGHMIEAAVAYFNATGKKEFLYIACKFADLVCRVFGLEEGKCKGYPGHQEIEVALVKLYQATGNRSYLTLADYFIRQRGQEPNYLMEEYKSRQGRNLFPEFREYDDKYAQVHAPVLKQETAEGHAVRAVYMYSAMADLARVERDEEMAAACQRLYENIVKKRMYITGGIGSSGTLERFTADYDLPNDRMYCESLRLRGPDDVRSANGFPYGRGGLLRCGGTRLMQYGAGRHFQGGKTLLLRKPAGGVAAELPGLHFYGSCEAGSSEMVWLRVLSAKYRPDVSLSGTIYLRPERGLPLCESVYFLLVRR